jgi:hypothetical protein
MRIVQLLCAAAFALIASSAGAQPPNSTSASTSADVSCPRGRLSIYFSSGDTTASAQSEALIDRIGETAASCNPDGIDLLARVDTRVDGDQALSVALIRLGKVADDLVARGVPVDRIRIAAQSASVTAALGLAAPNLNQIDVLFRKSSETADASAVAPVPEPALTAPGDAI